MRFCDYKMFMRFGFRRELQEKERDERKRNERKEGGREMK